MLFCIEQNILRAKFSAITPADIQKVPLLSLLSLVLFIASWEAMTSLGEPNKNESMAVEARQELDLKVAAC